MTQENTNDGAAGGLLDKRSSLSAEKQKLLAQRLKGRAAGQAPAAVGIPRRTAVGSLPLSFAQQRLWFLEQLMPGNPFYNVPSASHIEGPLDTDVLERCINEIVRRHESLRTTIGLSGADAVQVVHSHVPVTLPVIELPPAEPEGQDALIEELVRAEATAPFDLSQGVLRVKLVRIRSDRHLFLLTMHHIVTDGWSNGLFMRELMELYVAFSMGLPSPLPELPIQYGDFSQWQRERLQGGMESRQIGYWKRQLDRAPVLLQLPFDRARPATQSFRGAAQAVRIDAGLTDQLRTLSAHAGTTLFMTLLTGFAALLHRYSGECDMVIGTPTANRNHTALESLIGFFVNTLALRLQVRGDASFAELLAHVREVTLQAYDHQDVPFERLIDELGLERDMSRNPLIQATFALQNAPSVIAQVPHLTVRNHPLRVEAVRFDMEVHLVEEAGGLAGYFVYCTDLFDADTIARMIGHYEQLLRDAVERPQQPVARLALLTAPERQQLIHDWNQTDADYPCDRTALQLFEEQVERLPGATAVEDADAVVTYQELDRRANQLAHTLISRGVGLENLVGICLPRSTDLLVSMLAVWKAGAAYVPLDPALPSERLAFMAQDAQLSLVLTLASLQAAFAGSGAPTLCLDAEREALVQAPMETPSGFAGPHHLAYVIYTSGSTGLPKGVAIEHRGLVNYLSWAAAAYKVAEGEGAPVQSSIGFDATITSLFAPLIAGRSVILVPDGQEIEGLLVQIQSGRRFSLIKITPAHLDLLNHSPLRTGLPPQTFVIGGEALLGSTLSPWRARSPQSRFINEYGPTETVVGCCIHDVLADTELQGPLPIGRPIANTRLYVLDVHGEPVPVGIPGELYIGGDGVARGYLNRPTLTQEKFIPDRLSGRSGGRLYRTGDLARYRPDGVLQFLGRFDHQVKVRGHRIELGEVEAALLQHPDVREAVLVAREDRAGDKRLVSYIVPRDASRPSGLDCADASATLESMVRNWQQVFQDSYGKSTAMEVATDDFAGWNSSYTDRPIPVEEMTEWANWTVQRIAGLQPRRVLEIGCGTGLLLSRLAPECEHYLGTDFSQEALRHTRHLLATSLAGAPAEVLLGAAHDFHLLAGRSFDTVVMNSVVQYFPTLDYLVGVIEGVLGHLRGPGQIFIGDIRSLPLREAYHASVQSFKAQGSVHRDELATRVRQRAAAEEELLIDPRFFLALADRFPQITQVQTLLQRGRNHNELSKFRYEVVLHVGKPVRVEEGVESLDWQRQRASITDIRGMLANCAAPALRIRSIADARLQPEMRLLEWLADADGVAPLSSLPADTGPGEAIDPETLAVIGDQLGYVTEISNAAAKPGEFDATFSRPEALGGLRRFEDGGEPRPSATDASCNWSNNPLQTAFKRKLAAELRGHAKGKLPAFMVPSAFVMLDALPLTPNGKVDRDRLPAAEALPVAAGAGHVAPRTATETVLADLWGDILGVAPVGVEDNFFDLGGHSLLTTQVIARVRSALGVNLPLSVLFEHPTVSGLASVIDTAIRNGVTDIAGALQPLNLANEVSLDPAIQPAVAAAGEPNEPVAPKAIFLTGASGFLGAYLLRDLLRHTDARLHCLVRADTPAEGMNRLRKNLAAYGLWDDVLAARILPVPGDLEQPLLGLSPDRFDTLAADIDVIYHNGAWVNFTYPYRRLKASNVSGTQEVIRLAAQGRVKPLHFISTVSVFPATADPSKRVMETDPLTEWQGLASGYAQSKWVAEKIVDLAAKRGLPVRIYRPGTIAGDAQAGACHTGDLAFRMLKGCLQIGAAPDTQTLIGLVPVDYVSRAIVHLSQQWALSTRAFHLVNPRYVPLSQLIGVVASLGHAIEVKPYLQWRAALLQDAERSPDNALNPFLQMFTEETSEEREPHFDCRDTLAALVGTGIVCPDIDNQLMRTYFGFFIRSGFLPGPGVDDLAEGAPHPPTMHRRDIHETSA